MNRRTGRKFPLLALLVGGIGTVIAILGILAYTAPDLAVRVWPLLAQKTVADALIVMGAILMVFEMIMILQWIRSRRLPETKAADATVVRTRDRS